MRTPKPVCLVRNGSRWTHELLEALASGSRDQVRKARAKYNHPEVRQALDAMYDNLCCYCESAVGAVRADEIEHRRPVTGFPRYAFRWDNLHLACSGCNGAKSDRWDAANPILDAVRDAPIERHLGYESSETGVRQTSRTRRGHTTIEHASLNREKLRQSRSQVMLRVVGVIQEVHLLRDADPDNPVAADRFARLREMYAGEYGSMIEWAVDTLLSP
jgi:uncharacterized protein (TIGR02646 family)